MSTKFCPKCHSLDEYTATKGLVRCPKCKYEFDLCESGVFIVFPEQLEGQLELIKTLTSLTLNVISKVSAYEQPTLTCVNCAKKGDAKSAVGSWVQFGVVGQTIHTQCKECWEGEDLENDSSTGL